MKFHAPTQQFVFTVKQIESSARDFLYAIAKIRETAGLPMTPYEREGTLEPADHAQLAVIRAAATLGIDLGAEWGEELDVSDFDN